MQRFDIHLHVGEVMPLLLALIDRKAILKALQELKTMSGTLAQQLTDFQAQTSASLDALTTDLTDISADVDQLLAGMNTGDVVSQAMVDQAGTIASRMAALKAAADVINARVPPATPPTPTPTP